MHIRFITLALALATLGAAGACTTPAQSGAGASGSANPARAVTTIKVNNQAFLDMDVYVLPQNGARLRLGTATGNTSTVLTIPSTVMFGATQLRFIADPIGGQHAEVSTSILVSPGDQVVMTIPAA